MTTGLHLRPPAFGTFSGAFRGELPTTAAMTSGERRRGTSSRSSVGLRRDLTLQMEAELVSGSRRGIPGPSHGFIGVVGVVLESGVLADEGE
jgi:hypothetical protein